MKIDGIQNVEGTALAAPSTILFKEVADFPTSAPTGAIIDHAVHGPCVKGHDGQWYVVSQTPLPLYSQVPGTGVRYFDVGGTTYQAYVSEFEGQFWALVQWRQKTTSSYIACSNTQHVSPNAGQARRLDDTFWQFLKAQSEYKIYVTEYGEFSNPNNWYKSILLPGAYNWKGNTPANTLNTTPLFHLEDSGSDRTGSDYSLLGASTSNWTGIYNYASVDLWETYSGPMNTGLNAIHVWISLDSLSFTD